MHTFVDDKEEDTQIKKIYSLIKGGKTDLEIIEELNSQDTLNLEAGEQWTKNQLTIVIKSFNLRSRSPRFFQEVKTISEPVRVYINAHSKSKGVAATLTILFGPLGLFYSNWVAALILSVVTIALFATIIVPIISWILSIWIGISSVDRYNEKVKATAMLGAGHL